MKNILRYFLKHNFLAEHLDRQSWSYLKNCKTILEVGCGNGNFLKFAPEKIIGLDINIETLSRISFKSNLIEASAFDLPFKSNSIDGLHCAHVIEHLEPQQAYQFLKEVARTLRPNGIFVLETPIMWSGFYNNLTHIKPYNPSAITRYLVEHAPDTSYPSIPEKFEVVDLVWRYRPIYNGLYFLYLFGIHTFTKDAYTLVLRKK